MPRLYTGQWIQRFYLYVFHLCMRMQRARTGADPKATPLGANGDYKLHHHKAVTGHPVIAQTTPNGIRFVSSLTTKKPAWLMKTIAGALTCAPLDGLKPKDLGMTSMVLHHDSGRQYFFGKEDRICLSYGQLHEGF